MIFDQYFRLNKVKLNDKQKKRLSESVSQVLPIKYHDRMGIQSSALKQFKDLEDDDELDLSELMDDEVSIFCLFGWRYRPQTFW